MNGPKAELTAGMLATVRQVFPSVEAFAVGYRHEEAQNVILMCSRENLRPLIVDRYVTPGSWQERLIRTHVSAGAVPRSQYVFTDDHNPVDAIIARGLLEARNEANQHTWSRQLGDSTSDRFTKDTARACLPRRSLGQRRQPREGVCRATN